MDRWYLALVFALPLLLSTLSSYFRNNPVVQRHPILDKLSQSTTVPNNIYASDSGQNFHIISGPNMSGKSTYLSQICLLTIMAHIGMVVKNSSLLLWKYKRTLLSLGCFVPANFASVRLTDKLATRIGTEDSIESNCSSFLLEMKEMSYIVNNVTNRTLVVIGSHSLRLFSSLPDLPCR